MSHWQNSELYPEFSEWVEKVEGENQHCKEQPQQRIQYHNASALQNDTSSPVFKLVLKIQMILT
ncbi:hypothetical protein GHT06_018667 [Daphnia sinensis]|uniref:Uncharacterized protein n=1 Tax=Daphnia sinensis TaxID=1820382 RepID=A0AAD5PUW6_9CRUS|nr:hypothetical protein GHT06_018667 [Daphnia sinensis]